MLDDGVKANGADEDAVKVGDLAMHVLEAIERIAKAAALGARAPEPLVKIDPAQFTPALVNDPTLTKHTVGLLRELFGVERVHERPMSLGGEDFTGTGASGRDR